jgi:hypothetical protein
VNYEQHKLQLATDVRCEEIPRRLACLRLHEKATHVRAIDRLSLCLLTKVPLSRTYCFCGDRVHGSKYPPNALDSLPALQLCSFLFSGYPQHLYIWKFILKTPGGFSANLILRKISGTVGTEGSLGVSRERGGRIRSSAKLTHAKLYTTNRTRDDHVSNHVQIHGSTVR